MGNFFSTDVLLAAAGRAFFPQGGTSIVDVEVSNRTFRVLKQGGVFRLNIPFLDFLEPKSEPGRAQAKLRYLPRVSLKTVSTQEWHALPQKPGIPSPLIDWTRFSTWDEYVRFSRQTSERSFSKNTAYKLRRLSREVGDVSFDFECRAPEMLELCFRWKSAQYRADLGVDLLAETSRNRDFFRELLRVGALKIAVMKAGASVVALHLGVVFNERFYYWVPAYDAAYSRHSTGLILLEKMFEWSYHQKHREFDFLEGGEEYKFNYATHVRCIEALGIAPPLLRVWKPVRDRLIVQLRKNSRAYAFAQAKKKEWLNRKYQ